MSKKIVIGESMVLNGDTLSLSKAIRAGDFVFVTGQLPFKGGKLMQGGGIEAQTRACIEGVRDTLAQADCELSDVVKSMVWLKSKEDFAGFNAVYAEYFPEAPPARSALVGEFLVDVLVEIEVTAYKPSI